MKTKLFVVLAVLILASLACSVQLNDPPTAVPTPTEAPETVEAPEPSPTLKPLPLPEVTKTPMGPTEAEIAGLEMYILASMKLVEVPEECNFVSSTMHEMPDFVPAEPKPDAITSYYWGDETVLCGKAAMMYYVADPSMGMVMIRNITADFQDAQPYHYEELPLIIGNEDNSCSEEICWDQIVEFDPEFGMVTFIIAFDAVKDVAKTAVWDWHNQFYDLYFQPNTTENSG